jgi:hypothetical protein
MGWTAPRTWTTGEVVTAAILNAHVRDDLLETGPAKVTTAGDLLVATGANALKRLAKGTARQVPQVNSGATDIEWADSPQSVLTGGADLLYASAANILARLAKGTARQILQMNAAANAPEWAASPQSVLPGEADLLYASAANTLARLAKGTALQALIMNAAATAPEWAASLQSLLTAQGDIIYASAANTPARVAKGTAGQVLTMNSGATAPEWSDITRTNGTWSDSSTSISASSTFTKNIALGFSFAKGRLFAKGATNIGHVFGAILAFDTTAANTHGLMSYYKGAGVPSGNVNNHGAGVGIVSLDSDPADEQFGLKISLDSVRINGTNLELIFKNWDSGSAQTLNVDIYWEVE